MPIKDLVSGLSNAVLDFQSGYRGTYRQEQLAQGNQDLRRKQLNLAEQYQAARMAMMDQERERADRMMAERDQLGQTMVQSLQRQFEDVAGPRPMPGPLAGLEQQIGDLEALNGVVSPEAIALISQEIQGVAQEQAEQETRTRLMEQIGRMTQPPIGPLPDGTQVQPVLSEQDGMMLMQMLESGVPPSVVAQELGQVRASYEQDIEFAQAVNRIDSMLPMASPELARKWAAMKPFLPSGAEGIEFVNALGKEIMFGGTDPFLQKLVIEGMKQGFGPDEIMGYYQAGAPAQPMPQVDPAEYEARLRKATSRDEANAVIQEMIQAGIITENMSNDEAQQILGMIGAEIMEPESPPEMEETTPSAARMRGVPSKKKPKKKKELEPAPPLSETIDAALKALGYEGEGDPMEFLRRKVDEAKSAEERRQIRALMSALAVPRESA